MRKRSKHRLARSEFGVLRRDKRIAGAYFSLTTGPLTENSAKFACVVSTKVAKSAVIRNRIKRQCRDVVRKHISSIRAPLALAFYAKREAVRAEHADIVRDIESLIARSV